MDDKVIALFCGAGGLSYGFSQVGCAPAFSADIDADACNTYRTNLQGNCYQEDLGSVSDRFGALLNGTVGKVFAVIGGPPCQGFSTAGARADADPRNKLIFSYLDIVARVRPRWFLFENVEGLLTSEGGRSVTALVKAFMELGYWVRLEKVNFASFAVPQARKRVIIVGNRLGLQFCFPKATHSYSAGKHKSESHLPQAPSVRLALAGLGATGKGLRPYRSDLPESSYDESMRQGNNAGGVTLHDWTASDSDKQRFAQLKPGQTMKDLPPDLWHDSYRRRAFRRVADGTPTERRGGAPSGLKRLHPDLNSLTITSATTRELVHFSEDRPLTLREASRLQSFPDRFSFAGSKASVAQQIGNAFPPIAAATLAKALVEWDGKAGSDVQSDWSSRVPSLIGYRLTDATGMSPALETTDRLLSGLQFGGTLF